MARNRLWEAIRKVGRDLDAQVFEKSGPHGASELGAGLYGQTSNAYVMYGHAKPPETERAAAEVKAAVEKASEPQPAEPSAGAKPEPSPQPARAMKGRGR